MVARKNGRWIACIRIWNEGNQSTTRQLFDSPLKKKVSKYSHCFAFDSHWIFFAKLLQCQSPKCKPKGLSANYFHLLLAHDGGGPDPFVWVLQHDPGVDGGAEDVVEVVHDGRGQAEGAQDDEDDPEGPPKGRVRQGDVVEAVRRGPQVEA